MTNEVWVDIEGFEDAYQVSNHGRVRSKSRIDAGGRKIKGITRKLKLTNHGYMSINLKKGEIRKHFLVHRLVANAFIPNQENKPQVNHIDGNKENNHYSNLEWATRSENMIHADKTGLRDISGVLNPNAKLTETQVKEIRELRKLNPKEYTIEKLANKYRVSDFAVSGVVKGKTWKHVM